MQKNSWLVILTLSALTCIQISGCKKKCDTKPPDEEELCAIKHIEYTFAGQNSSADFTYNSHGNPVSINVSVSGTGNPYVIFFYDQYNRITDYISPYTKVDPANLPSEISFEQWIRYTYADQNPASMPIVDTSRTFGIYSNGQFSYSNHTSIEKYTYDPQGRIIEINSETYHLTYSYDANGNLVLPGANYDNKTNLRRTNNLWMFIDRDYSVNNPFTATTYNAQGLPVTIPGGYTSFIHRGLNLKSIDYSCEIKPAD